MFKKEKLTKVLNSLHATSPHMVGTAADVITLHGGIGYECHIPLLSPPNKEVRRTLTAYCRVLLKEHMKGMTIHSISIRKDIPFIVIRLFNKKDKLRAK